MRILLVKPNWFVRGGIYDHLRSLRFTPLSLGILAALSDGHEVRIVDGDWDSVPRGESFDLVGITATTFTSERAYALAKQFAEDGARVVMGGVHPSVLPDECLEHVHAVVVGEAEYVWKDLLRDAERGSLQRVYAAPRPTEMDDVPFPRRDLLHEQPWFACLQATRGCTNACRYCYLPSVPWHAHRMRSPELVAEEVRTLKEKFLYFVDDNLFGDRGYALRLLRAIAPHKTHFEVQAPTTIGADEELLDALADAGCFTVQIGFQSFNPKSLDWASVRHNRVDQYQALIERLHARNILVDGFFMFGFDTDSLGTFDHTAEMIRRIRVDEAHFFIVTPFPGTSLYAQFQAEGRLLPNRRRTQFGLSHAVFQPRQMTPEELEAGVQRMYDGLRGFFRGRTVRAFFKRLGLLWRHPSLARIAFVRTSRRRRVAEEPS